LKKALKDVFTGDIPLQIDNDEIVNLISGYEEVMFRQIQEAQNITDAGRFSSNFNRTKADTAASLIQQGTENLKTVRRALAINNQHHEGVDIPTYDRVKRFYEGHTRLLEPFEEEARTTDALSNKQKGRLFDNLNSASFKLKMELDDTQVVGLKRLPLLSGPGSEPE
jgi:hypothetical protein